jgi:hypothetical protein
VLLPNIIKIVRDGIIEGAPGFARLLPQIEKPIIKLHTEFGKLCTRIRDAWIQVMKAIDLNLRDSWEETGDLMKATMVLA